MTVSSFQKGSVAHRRLTRKSLQRTVKADTALIVNPSSASGLTGREWDVLFPKIKTVFGGNPKVIFTKKAGDGTVLTRNLLRKDFTRIVAVGGDGTLNEVANGFFEDSTGINGNKTKNVNFPSPSTLKLINPNATMAIMPCGTRNVLAKSLGLPEAVEECYRTFALRKPRRVDVISATVTNSEDKSVAATRVLLNAAEIGLGAEIIDRSKKVRKAINNRLVSTIAGIVSTLPTYQSNECELSLDDGTKRFAANMTMAIVANGSFLGGGFKAAPKADMSDGLLDLVILKDSGSLKMLDELINLKDGDYSEEDNIYYRQVRKVSIASKERDVTVTIDGEPIGILPATFEIMPQALKIRM